MERRDCVATVCVHIYPSACYLRSPITCSKPSLGCRYWKRTWHEGGVPEFELSPPLREITERFIAENLKGGYIALHWRMERTNWRDAELILQGLIRQALNALASGTIKHILVSTDLSFEFGTTTLDSGEFNKWMPIQSKLVSSLPLRPVMFNSSWFNAEATIPRFDRAMIGLIEQQLHVAADIFCPGIVRSGFVRTILRKRYARNAVSQILLPADQDIWDRDLDMYKRTGVLKTKN